MKQRKDRCAAARAHVQKLVMLHWPLSGGIIRHAAYAAPSLVTHTHPAPRPAPVIFIPAVHIYLHGSGAAGAAGQTLLLRFNDRGLASRLHALVIRQNRLAKTPAAAAAAAAAAGSDTVGEAES
jgi:ADP-ribosylglycohydrolase